MPSLARASLTVSTPQRMSISYVSALVLVSERRIESQSSITSLPRGDDLAQREFDGLRVRLQGEVRELYPFLFDVRIGQVGALDRAHHQGGGDAEQAGDLRGVELLGLKELRVLRVQRQLRVLEVLRQHLDVVHIGLEVVLELRGRILGQILRIADDAGRMAAFGEVAAAVVLRVQRALDLLAARLYRADAAQPARHLHERQVDHVGVGVLAFHVPEPSVGVRGVAAHVADGHQFGRQVPQPDHVPVHVLELEPERVAVQRQRHHGLRDERGTPAVRIRPGDDAVLTHLDAVAHLTDRQAADRGLQDLHATEHGAQRERVTGRATPERRGRHARHMRGGASHARPHAADRSSDVHTGMMRPDHAMRQKLSAISARNGV